MIQAFFNPLQDQAGIEEKGKMGGKGKALTISDDMSPSC